jgi:diguanylate cyclase (GGDEF)-like protein/PAS domain S-box-containing protein
MRPLSPSPDVEAPGRSPTSRVLPSSSFEALFVQGLDGVLIGTADGQLLRANARACAVLGRTEAELVELGWAGLADPGDPHWAGAVQVRSRTGAVRDVLRMRRADGSTFSAEVISAEFTDGGQAHVYLSLRPLSTVDLSRIAEARHAVAEVIDGLEAISDMYVGVDAHWGVTYINGPAERRLGISRETVLGRELWQAFPALVGTPFEDAYRRVRSTGEPVVLEAHYEAADLWCEARAYPLRRGGLSIYFRDIAERRAAEQERERLLAAERAARAEAEQAQRDLAHQATHDEVTGLLNRAGLLQQVDEVLAARPDAGLTVLFIDLDRFKLVNDSLGHATGDQVLAVFARRLAALAGSVPPAGCRPLMARFGGDEFVVVLVDASAEDAGRLAELVVAASRETVDVGPSLLVTASVGLATASGGADLERLLREADAALYRAKDAGRERAAWFDEQLHAESVRRMAVERELRAGLPRQELSLAYQPAFDLRSGTATHVEALVRWQHPARGLVLPLEFIPVAEESGLIARVGEWVLARAVEQAVRWAEVPGLRVWVNVSPQQLADPGLPDLLAAQLDRAALPADRLGIEVTESVLADVARLTERLREVRALGVAVAIDDFGTGYSSLARLTTCPVDVIKIDRSFVAEVGTARGEAVLAGIVTLAHATGAHVVAEGVETEQQLAVLRSLGADSASGFLLARPTAPGAVPLVLPDAR